ncbi:MAG: hypothetical protein HYV09_38745 [Deltaproteobacteria bacterium]|nr:hypothetical protein [Deltaproteobacteria bacterium]
MTIVETMMVVAILGVIAALATVGVSGYLRHAKTAEATRVLGNIEIGARARFGQPVTLVEGGPFVHTFCPTSTMLPASVPRSQRVKVDAAEWSAPTWQCLKFSINDPQYYAYRHEWNGESGTAARYTATAYGDLDGDGSTSTFQLIGRGGTGGDAERVSLIITLEDE